MQRHRSSRRRGARPLAALVLLLFACGAGAQAAPADAPPSWALFLDNDAFLLSSPDRDYTGGMALTLAGSGLAEAALSPVRLLDRLDAAWLTPAPSAAALQLGSLAFTPEALNRADVVRGDRPYASWLYVAGGRAALAPDGATLRHTSLSVGMLGLDFSKALHRMVHAVLDVTEPQGWDHQISDGGEPSARYAVTWWRRHAAGEGWDVKTSWGGSLGYRTEAQAGVSARWGRIRSPWWSFTPEAAEYIHEPAPAFGAAGRPSELFLWGGARLRARLYDAFLQGQFRESDLEYAYGDLRPLVGQLWLGLTRQFAGGYGLSWVAMVQSSELRTAPGDRAFYWGGVLINRTP